jgi:hypothetical protein
MAADKPLLLYEIGYENITWQLNPIAADQVFEQW